MGDSEITVRLESARRYDTDRNGLINFSEFKCMAKNDASLAMNTIKREITENPDSKEKILNWLTLLKNSVNAQDTQLLEDILMPSKDDSIFDLIALKTEFRELIGMSPYASSNESSKNINQTTPIINPPINPITIPTKQTRQIIQDTLDIIKSRFIVESMHDNSPCTKFSIYQTESLDKVKFWTSNGNYYSFELNKIKFSILFEAGINGNVYQDIFMDATTTGWFFDLSEIITQPYNLINEIFANNISVDYPTIIFLQKAAVDLRKDDKEVSRDYFLKLINMANNLSADTDYNKDSKNYLLSRLYSGLALSYDKTDPLWAEYMQEGRNAANNISGNDERRAVELEFYDGIGVK